MIKKISIPIYYGHLVIIQKKRLENIPNKWKPEGFDLHGFEALSYYVDSKTGYRYFVLAFEKKTNPRIITHESLHCVHHIFNHKNIKYDQLNDEHGAYLIGWIVTQCHKYLKIKP
jgi:hypothetical protein